MTSSPVPEVGPGEVAVSEVGAGLPVVAADPGLVEVEVVIRLPRGHRHVPPPTVRRAADQERIRGRREREADDHPHAVPGVVRDDGVAGPRIEARRGAEHRQAGEEAGLPRQPGIGGRRPADVGGAAVNEAPALERRHLGGTEAEAVGLDLRLVLAGRVSVRVARDLQADHLAVGRDRVPWVRGDDVPSGPAADRVHASAGRRDPVGLVRADDYAPARRSDDVLRGRRGRGETGQEAQHRREAEPAHSRHDTQAAEPI